MDPATILGVAGSVLGLGDVIARSLKGLLHLQVLYKTADLLVTIVVGYLSTVKAALDHIHGWMISLASESGKKNLIDEISTAVGHCRIIADVLYSNIDALQRNTSQQLTRMGKLAYLLGEDNIKDMSMHLSNQVQALHLLISASQCKTAIECNDLLQDAESRSVLQQVQDDSMSCIVSSRRPASSISQRSAPTEPNQTKLEAKFDFDGQILNSNLYLRTVYRSVLEKLRAAYVRRPLLRLRRAKSIGSMQPDASMAAEEMDAFESIYSSAEEILVEIASQARETSPATQTERQSPRSIAFQTQRPNAKTETGARPGFGHGIGQLRIPFLLADVDSMFPDRSLGRQRLPFSHEAQGANIGIAIVGIPNSGKTTLATDMKLKVDCTFGLRNRYRFYIWRNAIRVMRTIIKGMLDRKISFSDENSEDHADFILSHDEISDSLFEAVKHIRHDYDVLEYVSRTRHSAEIASFIFDDVERILHPNYVPTNLDILKMMVVPTTGVMKSTIKFNQLQLDIYDLVIDRPSWPSWPFVRNKRLIIFAADISCYAQTSVENATMCRMEEQLDAFDLVCSNLSEANMKIPIILCFTRVDMLEANLSRVPLNERYPKYSGSTVFQAEAFIARLFQGRAKRSQRVRVVYNDISEETSPAACCTSLVKRLIEEKLI